MLLYCSALPFATKEIVRAKGHVALRSLRLTDAAFTRDTAHRHARIYRRLWTVSIFFHVVRTIVSNARTALQHV